MIHHSYSQKRKDMWWLMIKRLVSVLAVLLLVGFILLYPGWSHVFATLLEISLSLIIVLSLLQALTILLSTYIWYSLLKGEIPFIQVLGAYLTGSFMESVTPAVKLGGELVKVYLFSKLSSRSSQELLQILFCQKYISLLPFIILCLLLLIPAFFLYSLPLIVYISLFVVSLIFFVVFYHGEKRDEVEWSSKLFNPLKKIVLARENWSSILSNTERKRLLLVSTLIWFFYPVKVFLVAKSLQALTDPIHSTISTFSAYSISMIPLLPGGLGSFEGSLAYFFTLNGNPSSKGLAIALTSRLFTFYLPLILSSIAAILILQRISPKTLRLKTMQGGMNG